MGTIRSDVAKGRQAMKLTKRAYRGEADYWRIREFLREVFLANGRRELSWHVARWDYWRWHGMENMREYPSMEAVTFLWETADGRIAAVLTPEGRGEAFPQVHPGYRTPELEQDIVAMAEEHLAEPAAGERRRLRIWVDGKDAQRQDMLTLRGYHRSDGPEYQRRRSLSTAIPDVPIAVGYTVRALGDADELPARSWASWKAFHPDEPDEQYQGWTWYRNIQRAPLYRRDLDMVAVAADGEIATFCTIWFDDVTRSAYIEPVGTMPAHQRRGLGKAVMYEGLRRLARLGATLALVGSYAPAAHALYASVGFTEYDLLEPWGKTW
jgi:mycothiol synthase